VFALPLHPAVLEPDLDLALGQSERVCNLDPATSGQVPVEVELLLQLQCLVARVGRPRSLRVVVGARRRRRRRRRRVAAADARGRRCSTHRQYAKVTTNADGRRGELFSPAFVCFFTA